MFETILNFPLPELIQDVGYIGIFLIVLAESGMPFGFIFPGDTLLFASGLVASQGFLKIEPLIAIIVAGAILGDSIGYWFGQKVGPRIFTKEDSFLFNKKHIQRTQEFYSKYGARAIILARFLPVVRAFVPIFAGVGMMPYKKFLAYNVIGGVLWGFGLTLLGFLLGKAMPNAEQYLLPIVAGIMLISFMPIILELIGLKKKS